MKCPLESQPQEMSNLRSSGPPDVIHTFIEPRNNAGHLSLYSDLMISTEVKCLMVSGKMKLVIFRTYSFFRRELGIYGTVQVKLSVGSKPLLVRRHEAIAFCPHHPRILTHIRIDIR